MGEGSGIHVAIVNFVISVTEKLGWFFTANAYWKDPCCFLQPSFEGKPWPDWKATQSRGAADFWATWACSTGCFQCWPEWNRMMLVVAKNPAPLLGEPHVHCCDAGLVVLLKQGEKFKLSKLRIIHVVLGCRRKPWTSIICTCSRKCHGRRCCCLGTGMPRSCS